MTAPRRKTRSAQAQEPGPRPDDPVLGALGQAESHYRAMYLALEQERTEAHGREAHAREDAQRLSKDLVALRDELEAERRRARQQHEAADTLAAALHGIHRSLFSSNIYDLILKTCLSLTGATRGLYATTAGKDASLRVRAAVDIGDYPSSPPSSFIAALCRAALENERVTACNDISLLPQQPGADESFKNCVVAPVVLRNDLSGVVIVADKAGGDFDEHDADVLLSVGSHAAVALENSRLQREVQDAYLSIVTVLAETMAARTKQAPHDQESGSRAARLVAERLGLSEHERSIVYYAALLHDIGNIGISDGVLNKPGPLMDAERELIRAHTQIGHDLLREVPVLDAVAGVVRHHHERYDGTGYPDGLQGEAIPIAARIVAVVDAYSAMLAARSYRPALSTEQAREQLEQGAGSQFDPRVVAAFLAVVDSVEPQVQVGSDGALDVDLPGLSVARRD